MVAADRSKVDTALLPSSPGQDFIMGFKFIIRFKFENNE